MNAIQTIGTILKHDRKINTYKIALIRAINDLALSYPGLTLFQQDIAIPLQMIARFWLAYYWPFCDSQSPILQGQQAILDGKLRNDIAFRDELTFLRTLWKAQISPVDAPQDGFFVMDEMQRPSKKRTYSLELGTAYQQAIQKIIQAIRQPIQYAGPGEWSVFDKPARYQQIQERCIALPETKANDYCVIVSQELWAGFQEISLYIEALCIHEWSLFTERKNIDQEYHRGMIYQLLTARPDNRRPLDWERNLVDILLMEAYEFACPWTGKRIKQGVSYDLDHIIPLAVYPTNEMWNLVPADPDFNSHRKRDRLPSYQKLQQAYPHLVTTYQTYGHQTELSQALKEDARSRFLNIDTKSTQFPDLVTEAVSNFVEQIGASRNIARF
jgi:hypothetical protein